VHAEVVAVDDQHPCVRRETQQLTRQSIYNPSLPDRPAPERGMPFPPQTLPAQRHGGPSSCASADLDSQRCRDVVVTEPETGTGLGPVAARFQRVRVVIAGKQQ
jgi:hypothetical protein